jgi:bifunctional ADP-heptose synthase (sugar kinase/adenylyltransferase)
MSFSIKKSRFEEIKAAIPGKKVLILGDVGVDRYTVGTASRLSPEAPVPVLLVTSQTDKLGMAANVADNVRAFGASPLLCSVVGEDRVCEEFYELLGKSGIDGKHVHRHASRRTSLKERVIAQPQHIVRIDHEKSEPLSRDAEDYAKGVLTEKVLGSVIAEARRLKKFITADPTTVQRRPADYQGVSLFKPNRDEAARLAGIDIRDEATLHAAGELLLKEVGAETVIITRGSAGMTLFTGNETPVTIPTFARDVYDVSGAGDTVISMLTLALVCGATLVESSLLANFAAGVEVAKQGTATVSLAELEQHMRRFGALV